MHPTSQVAVRLSRVVSGRNPGFHPSTQQTGKDDDRAEGDPVWGSLPKAGKRRKRKNEATNDASEQLQCNSQLRSASTGTLAVADGFRCWFAYPPLPRHIWLQASE